jgi:hypothetical protein
VTEIRRLLPAAEAALTREAAALRRLGVNIVARAAELLADAAGKHGVSVTVVYSVTGGEGGRFYSTSFDAAQETARRVAAGERAA